MTVKELKEELSNFNDNLLILLPSGEEHRFIICTNAALGVNEMDGCVILDNYSEKDD